MSEREKKIINYLVLCIDEFAKQKKISRQEAYNYLKKYKGLEFLVDKLKYKELTDQYSFHTEKALKYLKGV